MPSARLDPDGDLGMQAGITLGTPASLAALSASCLARRSARVVLGFSSCPACPLSFFSWAPSLGFCTRSHKTVWQLML